MRPLTVTIIGAGPGGLAASLLLARLGVRVRVLERLPRVGGRTSALEADGFRFDLGPTFFLYPEVLEDIFAEAGRDLWTEVPMTRLDPHYRLTFGAGGSLDATPDVEAMERRIAQLSPGDVGGFRRFLDDNRRKLERIRPVLETAFEGPRDLLKKELRHALPALNPWRSVGRELQHYFRDPRLTLAFSFQAKYLGMSPFQCPSLFSILSFLEYEHGVFHPTGGCSAICEAMARIAREMGVEIHLGEPVERIAFQGRRAVGVRTSRDEYGTDALVINADFARTIQKLVPDHLRRRWTDRRITRKKFSCSTFMMYFGIEGLYEHLPHHSIYIAENYDRNLDEIERLHVLSEDPSFYVQNAGVTDGTLAPEGMSTLYVLVPVTHTHPNVDWSAERGRYRNLIIDRLSRVGITDLERRIRFERIVTPDDWDQRYEIHRGATFNLTHSLNQMLHLRPHNRFEDLEGVYLVGGGTHPGSGLPVIFKSARITSELIREDLGLAASAPVPAQPRSQELAGSP